MFGAKLAALVLAASCCLLGGGAEASSGVACEPTPEASRELVLSFYKLALVDKRPRAAFERFVSVDFIEHKPDVPGGGRAEVADFLENLVKELPDAKWEILRTVAEKDLVFLHARFTPAPGAPPYAIADVFRIENCAIVEHWDVVGPPREGQPNSNSRF
jgi:predicted SnoaL-like aldol condensation-catalyzing enzyme